MPFYDYKCTKGHIFEVMQPIMDDALTECIECGEPVERILHSPAVHFKGSGFYSTDYGSSKKGARGGTDTGSESSKDSSSESSSNSEKSSSSDSSSSSPSETKKKSESKAKASSKSD